MNMPSEGMRLGDYILRKRLDADISGEIWLAESGCDESPVVVRFLPRTSETLADAPKALFKNAKLDAHPNLVQALDVLIEDDRSAIISKFFPTALDVSNLTDYRTAAQIASGILNGLAFLHENGICHGFLTPSHIRLDKNVPQLADYGLIDRLPQAVLTAQPINTLFYLSPSALDGDVSQQGDIWSVGVILYQLTSGYLPYPQQNHRDLVAAIRTLHPNPLPSGLPKSLHDIIYKALERSPKKSYQNASEMRTDLSDFLESWQERPTLIFEAASPPTRLDIPAQETPTAPDFASNFPTAEPPRKKTVSGRAIIIGGGVFCLLFVVAMFAVARRFEQKTYYKQVPPKFGSLGPLSPASKSPPSATEKPTLIVSRSGGDYTTIAAALAKASNGMRILVRPGVYSESLTINKEIEIIGEGARNDIVIETRQGPCLTHTSGKASLVGLTLMGRGAQNDDEFFAVSATGGDLTLEDCVITSDTLACIAASGLETSVSVRRCVIRDGQASGIGAWSGARIEAEACDISGHKMAGVVVSKGASVTLRRCEVKENSLFGVRAYDKGAATVEQCKLIGNTQGAFSIEPGSSLTSTDNQQ